MCQGVTPDTTNGVGLPVFDYHSISTEILQFMCQRRLLRGLLRLRLAMTSLAMTLLLTPRGETGLDI
ncbi:MAG: hypothetical protein U9R01_06900 [candidate division WOR-3 bacterium]|nr:hypothetical protein [candidate division WOR-3 bacterium]